MDNRVITSLKGDNKHSNNNIHLLVLRNIIPHLCLKKLLLIDYLRLWIHVRYHILFNFLETTKQMERVVEKLDKWSRIRDLNEKRRS